MQALHVLNNFSHGKWFKKPTGTLLLNGLEWKIQNVLPSSILFYKTTNNLEIKKLLKTLSVKNVAIVVVDDQVAANELDKDVNCYVCNKNSWMELQNELANIFYPVPRNVKFAAVTGTNGKTSTVKFLSQILSLYHQSCLSFGTLGIYYNNKKIDDVALTSPSFIDFRKIIFQNAQINDVVIFEMSSHALDQQRFYKINLTVAAWTSFSQDHLDYHKDMESYFNSKKKILNYLVSTAKLYLPFGQDQIYQKIKNDKRVELCSEWPTYQFKNSNSIFTASFAKDNFILAYQMSQKLIKGDEFKEIDLATIQNVPGRWMLKSFEHRIVIIDSAHTPDALINVCQNAKDAYPDYKIKVLFGCGGDRDKSKRPLMAKVVSAFATYIYVTSDNPRTEDADSIIEDIIPGISVEYYRNADREETLKKALKELSTQELLIVAGKGHENYIIKGTTKFPYSDELVCDDYILKKAT